MLASPARLACLSVRSNKARVGNLGAAVVLKGPAGKAAAIRRAGPVRQGAKVINTSIRRMQIPQVARQLVEAREAKTPKNRAKNTAKAETFQVNGDGGGYATYSVDVNQADRTFAGTIVYAAYLSDGMVLNGEADVLGTFDENYQGFTRLTISFKELSMAIAGYGYTLIGSLSWGYTPATSGDSLTINMILVDSGKTIGSRIISLPTATAPTI